MVEYYKCLEAGAVGGIGAVPGTLAAHGFDLIKIRQQLTGLSLPHAIASVYNGSSSSSFRQLAGTSTRSATSPSISFFFAGAIPAVNQKIATRAPMFLASSLSVQFFESSLGFAPTPAAFAGSAVSGYITGFVASPFEWQKVLVSQRVGSPAAGKGMTGLLSLAKAHHGYAGGFACIRRRFHAAGVRNAVFDSTFFGVKHIVDDWSQEYHRSRHNHMLDTNGDNDTFICTLASLGSGFAYGIAAISAVTVDYAVDVSVKRTYATGPERPIPSLGVLRHVLHIISKEGRSIFRGLSAKSVEFGVSYVITGLMAPYITRGIAIFTSDDVFSKRNEEKPK